MRDVYQVVDLRARADHGVVDASAIDGRPRADLHIILDDAPAHVRNLFVPPALVHVAESIRADARAGRLRGDPGRLQQVFWNLLTNAVKFTPSGGRIDVLMERVNSHVEVCVEDSGIGIKPEHLSVIWEDFRQVDQSRTREYGGTGLGLSITRKLVTRLGGSSLPSRPWPSS